MGWAGGYSGGSHSESENIKGGHLDFNNLEGEIFFLSHQEDNGLKDQFSFDEASINVSVDSDKPIFYDVDKVKKHNMISTFSKKTDKLAKAPFEGINPTLLTKSFL